MSVGSVVIEVWKIRWYSLIRWPQTFKWPLKFVESVWICVLRVCKYSWVGCEYKVVKEYIMIYMTVFTGGLPISYIQLIRWRYKVETCQLATQCLFYCPSHLLTAHLPLVSYHSCPALGASIARQSDKILPRKVLTTWIMKPRKARGQKHML
mgnify:CR=1 FL=1